MNKDAKTQMNAEKPEDVLQDLEAKRLIKTLRIALDESVKLQSHYAELLNMWDGGKRMPFANADAWIARLRETKTIKEQ